jgi:Domain of unknown function (DUF4382)
MMKPLSKAAPIVMSLGLAACSMHGSQPSDTLTGSSSVTNAPGVIHTFDVSGGIGPGRMNVLLGDAAPKLGNKTLTHLNIGIREIDAVSDGTMYVLSKYKNPRVVDVLAHQNNGGESVANAGDPQKTYQQIRLVVDIESSEAVFKGNGHAALNFLTNTSTFSTVHAGANTTTVSDGPGAVDIAVTQPFSISADADPAVRVDFNAFESLAMTQNQSVQALPALFVAPIQGMGAIAGTLRNARGGAVQNATIVAVASDGSIGNTTFTDDTGNFTLGTLRDGNYQLVIYNAYTTAAGQQVNASGATSNAQSVSGPAVTVTGGQTTSLGTIAD